MPTISLELRLLNLENTRPLPPQSYYWFVYRPTWGNDCIFVVNGSSTRAVGSSMTSQKREYHLSNGFGHMGMFDFASLPIAGLNEELQVRWDATSCKRA